MTEYRIVTAKYDPSGVSVTEPIYKGNYGNVLRLVDFPEGMVPETFEMHFSVGGGNAKTQIGTNNEVLILDECLTKAVPITAWLFLHDAATDGETKHEIRIPVKPKDNVTDAEPTPVEQSVITQAIAALNTGVERAEAAADAAEEAQEGAEAAATRAEQAAADAQGAAESAAEDAVEAVEQVLEGYKQAAESAATRAENSATDANASRESADQSATNAGISERNARASAEAAAQSVTEASGHAQTASQKATQASNYADNASASARSAEGSAGTAEAKASEASASANTASQKAQEAAASAGNASRSASDAEAAKTGAETAETNAESAATAAAGSASAAQTSAGNAASSATAAAGSASAASGSATAAAQSASNAAATLNSAVQTINAEKATAIQAIQNKGDEVIDSIPADYSELTEDVNSLKSAIHVLEPVVDDLKINKADVIISSASGAIASFSDGADNLPVKELTIGIEPVQDLHGYDHPWPAGGGKNLLDPSKRTGNDGATTYRWYESEGFTLKANQAYTFSCDISTRLYIRNKATSADLISDASPITYTPTEDILVFFQAYNSSGITATKFQLEKGSTATSFAPYSNICPISGFDSVKVTRTGKNLAGPISNHPNGARITGYAANGNWPMLNSFYKAGVYTLSFTAYSPDVNGNPNDIRLWFHRSIDKKWCKLDGSNAGTGDPTVFPYQVGGITTTPQRYVGTFTLPFDCDEITLGYYFSGRYLVYSDLQLELSSTATAYEPYAGQTYDITLPTEAGTVYGGELTVNEDGTGTLVVDRKSVDLGDYNWTKGNALTEDTGYVYRRSFTDSVSTGSVEKIQNIICSNRKTRTGSIVWKRSTELLRLGQLYKFGL